MKLHHATVAKLAAVVFGAASLGACATLTEEDQALLERARADAQSAEADADRAEAAADRAEAAAAAAEAAYNRILEK